MLEYFKRLRSHPGIGYAILFSVLGFLAGAQNTSAKIWWHGGLWGFAVSFIFYFGIVLVSNFQDGTLTATWRRLFWKVKFKKAPHEFWEDGKIKWTYEIHPRRVILFLSWLIISPFVLIFTGIVGVCMTLFKKHRVKKSESYKLLLDEGVKPSRLDCLRKF